MGINLGGGRLLESGRLFGKQGVIWEMIILVSAILFYSFDYLKFCEHLLML